MRTAVLLAILALAACRKEPRGAEPAPVEHRVDGGAAASRPPPDADASCVTECVRRNQMRAVSIEQIERDCRGECSGGPP